MTQTTLAIAALGSVITALLYIYVGSVLRKRPVAGDARLANNMFVLWWQSLGGLGLLGAVILVLYMAGRLEIWLYQSYVTFFLLMLFLALWGLQFYLVYLYTGTKRWFVPLGVFYGMLYLVTVALLDYLGPPQRIEDNGWQLRTEPVAEFGLAFNLAFALLIVGPAIWAAIAYARLYWKTDDATQKYRIALVTGSILVWFGSSLVGTVAQVTDSVPWQLFTRLMGVGGALAILMAYRPPRWVRAKLGVHGIETAVANDRLEAAPPPRTQ